MKTKLAWAVPVAAFAVAVLGAAVSGPSWASLWARTTAMMQGGGSGITVG